MTTATLNGTNGQAHVPAADGYRLIPLDRIRPSPTNPRKRFDEAKLQELADSIRSKGVLQPVLVRPAPKVTLTGIKFELVAGERRLRAAKLAGLTEIPATVRDLSDLDVLDVQLIENEQREDVSALEKADGYQRLIDAGRTVEDVAAKVGKSVSTIRGLLKLRQLPEKARKAIEDDRLPATTAQLIAGVPSAKMRETCAAEVLTGTRVGYSHGRDAVPNGEPMSYREAKDHIAARYMVELKQAPFSQKDPSLSGGACTTCPKKAGNNREEYPDARADICTDTACYHEKVAAWEARQLADAQAKGQKVLPVKEAEKLFPYGDRLTYDAPYFDLAAPCYEDRKAKKSRSYKQLLAGHIEDAQVVLARDGEGELHRLVPKDVALPILRKEHGLCKPTTLPSNDRTSDEEKRERARRQAENRLHRETTREVLSQAAGAAELLFVKLADADILANQVLRVFCRDWLAGLWGSVLEDVCARRGLKAKRTSEQREELGRLIGSLDAPQLLGLLAEFAAGRHLNGTSGGELAKTLRDALDIDRVRIERQVKERIKAEKAEKKTTGKPAKNGTAVVVKRPCAKCGTESAGLTADGVCAACMVPAAGTRYCNRCYHARPASVGICPECNCPEFSLNPPTFTAPASPPDGTNPAKRTDRLASLVPTDHQAVLDALARLGCHTAGDLLERLDKKGGGDFGSKLYAAVRGTPPVNAAQAKAFCAAVESVLETLAGG